MSHGLHLATLLQLIEDANVLNAGKHPNEQPYLIQVFSIVYDARADQRLVVFVNRLVDTLLSDHGTWSSYGSLACHS